MAATLLAEAAKRRNRRLLRFQQRDRSARRDLADIAGIELRVLAFLRLGNRHRDSNPSVSLGVGGLAGHEPRGNLAERRQAVDIRRQLRQVRHRVAGESSSDLVEVHLLLLTAGSQERVGARIRQHAVHDQAADG